MNCLPKPTLKFSMSPPEDDKFVIFIDYGKGFGHLHVVLNCVYFFNDRKMFLSCRVTAYSSHGSQMAVGVSSDVSGVARAFENAMEDLENRRNSIFAAMHGDGGDFDICGRMLWDAMLMGIDDGIVRGDSGDACFCPDKLNGGVEC